MRKWCIVLTGVLMMALTGCQGKSAERLASASTDESRAATTEAVMAEATKADTAAIETDTTATDAVKKEADASVFSNLADLEFRFSSGAGAWSTTVEIQADGTFSGFYLDSNAGDRSDDYPNGTREESHFTGRFSAPVKIGDYEYTMKCQSLTVEGEVGEEKIIDGAKVRTSDPYGFDNADEFLLYLPGKKISELPEMYLSWVSVNPEGNADESIDKLTFYGLYNAGGEQGFSSYEK